MRALRLLALFCFAVPLAGCPTGGDDDDDETNLPQILHEPTLTSVEATDVPLTAAVTPPVDSEDDFALVVALQHRAADGGAWNNLPMEPTEATDQFSATIPADAVAVVGVEYYISAQWGSDVVTHPTEAPDAPHRIVVSPEALTDPAPLRARYDASSGTVVLSWTPSLTSAYAGYSVEGQMGTADPETVCQASDADGTCSVPAEGTWDQDYASWTVTVTDGEGNGLSADATTDSLHLLLASYAKEVTDEDPSPFGQGQLEFFLPYGVAVDGSSVHVAEQSNNRLHSFSDSGVFLGFVGALGGGTGASGSGDGEFDAPHDVTVGPSGNLYIADHSNARVQVLDGTTRQPLFSFGSLGTGDGQLRFPVSLAFDGLDQLHVAESVNARVSMYDAEGNFLSTYSSGAEPFVSPTRIAWLPEIGAMAISDLDVVHIVPVGDAEAATWEVIDDATAVASGLCPVGWGETLVTLDDPSETVGSVGHTVVRLDADGAVVSSFGAWGVGEGDFWRPVDCAVDEVGDIWVADGLNHRIQVFGP